MNNEVEINIGATEDVSQTVERMADNVEAAQVVVTNSMASTEEAFDSAARSSGRFGEGLDRMSGATSQLSGGLGDVGGALTEAFGEDHPIGQFGAEMEKMGTIVMGLTGVMDLLALANTAVSLSWIRTTSAMVGAKIATIAQSVATGVATAAQWLWNIAMTANPIGLIIVAVAALVAGIIWLATQTDFFSKLWNAIWEGIVAYIGFVVDMYKKAFNAIVSAGTWLWNQFKTIVGGIKGLFSNIASVMTAPFRAAFNAIASMWNRTIGSIRFQVPNWVPGIGGNGFSVPRLPMLAVGADITRTGMAVVHQGERILPAGHQALSNGGVGTTIIVKLEGGSQAIRDAIREIVKIYGGDGPDNVQIAFG